MLFQCTCVGLIRREHSETCRASSFEMLSQADHQGRQSKDLVQLVVLDLAAGVLVVVGGGIVVRTFEILLKRVK